MTQQDLVFLQLGKGGEARAAAKLLFAVIFVCFKLDLDIQFNFYSFQNLFIHLN